MSALSREEVERLRLQIINGPSPPPHVVPIVVLRRETALAIVETAKQLAEWLEHALEIIAMGPYGSGLIEEARAWLKEG